MVRLFYHKPKIAFLDECKKRKMVSTNKSSTDTNIVFYSRFILATSAVSAAVENAFYAKCKELNITFLSVAHRKSVIAYHEKLLIFDDKKCYVIR